MNTAAHPGRPGPRRDDGFTLVELLVVVVLVAVLAGLLLPALAGSRAAARGARCTANLRQLGLAAQMYWDDHAGRAFVERGARTNGGWNYWFGWLGDGEEGQRVFDPTRGALWPYLRGRGVEVCPSLDRAAARFKPKAAGASFGYGYNLRVGTRGESGIRMATVRAPESLAIFADCAQVNDFQAPASPEDPMLEEFHYFDTAWTTVHFRHRGRAECGFADGHVATATPEPGTLDARLPGETIARLPPTLVEP